MTGASRGMIITGVGVELESGEDGVMHCEVAGQDMGVLTDWR